MARTSKMAVAMSTEHALLVVLATHESTVICELADSLLLLAAQWLPGAGARSEQRDDATTTQSMEPAAAPSVQQAVASDTRTSAASSPLRLPLQRSLWNLHHNAHKAPARLVRRNRSSEMRSQRAPLPRELAHYRADSLPASTHTTHITHTHTTTEPPRLSVCSTSGMVYESVVVVGHVVGSDHVVYYLLEVRSWDRPLEGYVVRRRYNDFKRLHQELSTLMPSTTKPRSSSYSGGSGSGFGLPYSSLLLCTPLASTNGDGELHLLWSPKRLRTAMSIDDGDDGDESASTRKNTRSSSDDLESLDARTPSPQVRDSLPESWTLDPLLSPPPTSSGRPMMTPPATLTVEYDVPAAAAQLGRTYYDSNLTLPLDRVKFTMADRAVLPDLPPAGVAALFATQHARIKHRVEQFNAILAAVMSDTSPAVATVLMNFIQEKPGGQVTSYTSLSEYAAIDMPWQVERYARRRAMSMGRRPPTLSRDVSSSSSVGSAGRSSGAMTVTPPISAP